MNRVRQAIKTRLEHFWLLVDSDSIIINQMLFYGLISLGGLYNLAYSNVPIQSVEESTTSGYYIFFLWLCFLGPLACIIGKCLRGSLTYAGLWLQLAGDIATEVIFWAYIGAIISTTWWGKANFAAFLALACLIGVNVFIARDIRRLRNVERVAGVVR